MRETILATCVNAMLLGGIISATTAHETVEIGGIITMGIFALVSGCMVKHMTNDRKHTINPVSDDLCNERVERMMREIKHSAEMTELLLKSNGIEVPERTP